ncbi:MAG TPA: alpha/beta hydrolase [Pirellulaceae bacterium]|nr:alpha/beta hydrolase [Pirellulaceae bacterium]
MRRRFESAIIGLAAAAFASFLPGRSTNAAEPPEVAIEQETELMTLRGTNADPVGEEAVKINRGWNWSVAYFALGQSQFWSDEFERAGYRIQRNSETKSHRLLSPTGKRLVSGDFETCQTEIDRVAADEGLPPHAREVVICLHGLCRTRGSMASIARTIEEETGFEAINIGYASSREPIDAHAATLERMLARMPEVERVHFVGHSMGNLVVRRFLARRASGVSTATKPEIGRIVMIAPPNQGSRVAGFFAKNPLFGMIWGKSGKEIAGWTSQLQRELEIPDGVEFGIIAGTNDWGQGYNPLLSGNDDLIVSVEETKLPGAADFRATPALHSFIMHDRSVKQLAVRFLQTGLFGAPEEALPLPKAIGVAEAQAASAEERR